MKTLGQTEASTSSITQQENNDKENTITNNLKRKTTGDAARRDERTPCKRIGLPIHPSSPSISRVCMELFLCIKRDKTACLQKKTCWSIVLCGDVHDVSEAGGVAVFRANQSTTLERVAKNLSHFANSQMQQM